MKKANQPDYDQPVEEKPKVTTVVNPELQKGRVVDYEVPKGEEHVVHAEIEQVQFNSATGEKRSRPTVQKFDVRSWDIFRKNAALLGFNYIKVLHFPAGADPTIPNLDDKKIVKV